MGTFRSNLRTDNSHQAFKVLVPTRATPTRSRPTNSVSVQTSSTTSTAAPALDTDAAQGTEPLCPRHAVSLTRCRRRHALASAASAESVAFLALVLEVGAQAHIVRQANLIASCAPFLKGGTQIRASGASAIWESSQHPRTWLPDLVAGWRPSLPGLSHSRRRRPLAGPENVGDQYDKPLWDGPLYLLQ